jgi:hypothetical protein
MQHPGLEDGLAVLVHETTDSTLTYREFDKFVNFIKHKDFEGLPEAHLARGLPEVGFVESYRRFAKSLIAVGSGAGQDRPVGLEIEIVALSNPYTDDLSEGMAVQVLLNAAPRADVQVEVFSRPAGTKEPALDPTVSHGRRWNCAVPGAHRSRLYDRQCCAAPCGARQYR